VVSTSFTHSCSPFFIFTNNSQQLTLKSRLIETDDISFSTDNDFSGLRYIGGVDLSFVKDNNNDAIASLVVLAYPALEV